MVGKDVNLSEESAENPGGHSGVRSDVQQVEAKLADHAVALDQVRAQARACEDSLAESTSRLRATELALEASQDLVERLKSGRVLRTMMNAQELVRRLAGNTQGQQKTVFVPARTPGPGKVVSEYVRVWEDIAVSPEGAYLGVMGSTSEAELLNTGKVSAQCLRDGLRIEPSHKVLEVGCGVARIGSEMAADCLEWHGCDISDNMIQHARKRTVSMKNVYLRTLKGCSLEDYPDNYFDRVYCHIVLFHLQKEDVYTYIKEMGRVLKPNGIAYYDTWNLCNDDGFERWEVEVSNNLDPTKRPVHRNRWSTPEEMRWFTQKAGLEIVELFDQTWFVQVLATKVAPGDDAASAVRSLQDHLSGSWDVLIPKVKWCAFGG